MKKDLFEFAQGQEKVPLEKETKTEEKKDDKVEVKPYKVFGQDFSLSDPEIIDYYKTRMKMMTIKYRLVGKVNENAQYKVPDPIRRDLINMEKEIEETGEDFYKAIALYMKKHFYFYIKIVPIEEGKAKASLFLSEYVEDFLGMEYIVSHIADFIDVYDDDYRIKLRKAFNLVDVATKVDDFAVPDLAVLMQDCFDLELVVGGLYDMASQIFLMRMLKLLEEAGPAGAKVLAKYRELLAKSKDVEIDEKFRNSYYKALLDRAIDELGGYEKLGLDPKALSSIMKDINGTVKAIDNASGKGGYVEMEGAIKPQDKKAPSESSSGGGSKKSKSSSGGGNNNEKPSKSMKPLKSKSTVKSTTTSTGGASLDWMGKVVEVVLDTIDKAKDAIESVGHKIERQILKPEKENNNRFDLNKRNAKPEKDNFEDSMDDDFGEMDEASSSESNQNQNNDLEIESAKKEDDKKKEALPNNDLQSQNSNNFEDDFQNEM